MAAALASSPLVHLTASRLRLPRPRASVASSAPGCSRGVCLGWRLAAGWRAGRRCERLRCFSSDGGGGEEGEKRGEEEASAAAAPGEELGSERSRSGSFSSSSSSAGVRCYGVFRHTILKCTRDQPFEMQWSTRGMLYDLFFFSKSEVVFRSIGLIGGVLSISMG